MFQVDNKLQTKVYVKPTERHTYLHSKSEHPYSTKEDIAYNHVSGLSKICYNRRNHHNNCKQLINTLTKTSYNKTATTTQINCAIPIPQNE